MAVSEYGEKKEIGVREEREEGDEREEKREKREEAEEEEEEEEWLVSQEAREP